MLQSSRLHINYPDPLRTDTADVPRDFGSIITWLEGNAMGYGQGTLAARPTSTGGSPGQQGRIYVATDQTPHQVFYDYGTGWDAIGGLGAGSVTASMLASDVAVIPVGGMIDWPWASGSLPAWALLPYGQAISRSTYAVLSALANTTGYAVYGAGDGSTTFNVPDLRGRVAAGKDDMGGTVANRITAAISGVSGATLGAVLGSEGITLTTAQLPAHNHAHTLTLPDHTHNYGQHGGGASTGGGFSSGSVDGGVTATYTSAGVNSTPAINGSISNAGSGSAHQNTQPTIIVNKLMRVL